MIITSKVAQGLHFKNKLLLLLFAVTIGFQSCQSQQNDPTTALIDSKAEQLNEFMTLVYNNNLFNGTILVSENGKVIYQNAFGYANFETDEKLVIDSKFYLASVSKQFTCMAIMILKERGKIKYDDKLSKYFPEFPDYADNITIRHLMTHTSGVPDHYRLGAYKKGLTNADVLKLLTEQEELDFNPGDKFSYSNGGYVLLSMVAERISGTSYREFMKTNVFEPLEMKNTLVFDETNPPVENRAVGYDNFELDDYEIYTTGAGGMYTTVGDLFLWDQALYTNKLVQKETMLEAYEDNTLNDGSKISYGFGWFVGKKPNIVEHGGGMNGYITNLRRNLEKNNALIYLTNNGNASAYVLVYEVISKILDDSAFVLPTDEASTEFLELYLPFLPPQSEYRNKLVPSISESINYSGRYIHVSDTDTTEIYVSAKNNVAILAYLNDSSQSRIFPFDSIHFGSQYSPDKYSFQLEADGKIIGLQVSRGDKDVVKYSKEKPEAAPAFMSDMKGHYIVDGNKSEFTFSNGVLRVEIPYDGAYIMIPRSDKEYVFANETAYSLKFTTDETNSIIKEIEYITPKGKKKLKAAN